MVVYSIGSSSPLGKALQHLAEGRNPAFARVVNDLLHLAAAEARGLHPWSAEPSAHALLRNGVRQSSLPDHACIIEDKGYIGLGEVHA